MRKLRTIEMNRLSIEEFKSARKMPLIVVLDDVRSLHNVGSVFRTCDAFRVEAIYLCGITATPPSNEIHKTALGAEDSVEWKYFKTAEEAVDELHRNGYFVYSVEQAEGSMKLNQLEVGWLKEDGGSDASQEKSMKERSTSYINHLPSEASLPPSSFNHPTSSPSSSPIGETLPPSSFNHPTSKYAVIFGNEVKGVHQSVIDMSDGCLEIPQFGTKHSMNVSVTAGIVIWEFAKQFI
ncbi:MAG: TrmH family RNA methyltransferase [Prevotella sp.]|nr:TrmH family RNA methyltransferase [Prevotella sp.]